MNGKDLQLHRGELGMSQQQIAVAIGVSTQTISRWERDLQPVPQYAIERLRDLRLDDHRSLARVSSKRLIDELATRAALWDAAGVAPSPVQVVNIGMEMNNETQATNLAQSRWDQIRAAKGLPPEILPPIQEGCPTKNGESWGEPVED